MHVAAIAHRSHLRRLLIRSAFVWLLVRTVLTFLGSAAGTPYLVPGPRTLLLLTAGIAVLAQVDARVMRETLLHENLGTHRLLPACVAVLVVLTLELVIRVAVAGLS